MNTQYNFFFWEKAISSALLVPTELKCVAGQTAVKLFLCRLLKSILRMLNIEKEARDVPCIGTPLANPCLVIKRSRFSS
jgi:hypothetical protein